MEIVKNRNKNKKGIKRNRNEKYKKENCKLKSANDICVYVNIQTSQSSFMKKYESCCIKFVFLLYRARLGRKFIVVRIERNRIKIDK